MSVFARNSARVRLDRSPSGSSLRALGVGRRRGVLARARSGARRSASFRSRSARGRDSRLGILAAVAVVGRAVAGAIAACCRSLALRSGSKNTFRRSSTRSSPRSKRATSAFVADASAERWRPTARRRAIRALRAPVAVAAVATIVLLAAPGRSGGAHSLAARRRFARARPRAAADRIASRLTPLVADVVAAGVQRRDARRRSTSRATFARSSEASSRCAAAATPRASSLTSVPTRSPRDRTRRPVVDRDFASRPQPVAIRLTDRTFQRIVAIEPVVDERRRSCSSRRRTTACCARRRAASRLAADASDDFGIATAAFEYIISSGEGETFKFKSGTLGAMQPSGRHATIASSISIDSLALKPGDIVHLRAVARDANNVTGPGIGVSETRAIRIARARRVRFRRRRRRRARRRRQERHQSSECSSCSPRRCRRRRPSLRRDTLRRRIATRSRSTKRSCVARSATSCSRDWAAIRAAKSTATRSRRSARRRWRRCWRAPILRRIAPTDPIDFEGDESPVVAVNKPLLEAYNAMWDAGRELEIGEPGRALPHMRRALAAIQKRETGRAFVSARSAAARRDRHQQVASQGERQRRVEHATRADVVRFGESRARRSFRRDHRAGGARSARGDRLAARAAHRRAGRCAGVRRRAERCRERDAARKERRGDRRH